MNIKILGALMILISGSSIGWIIGSRYLNRVEELRRLQTAISMVDTEISYGQTVLAKALQHAAAPLDQSLATLFVKAAQALEESCGATFAEMWEKELSDYQHNLFLIKEDILVLKEWGSQLGNSSLINQNKINLLTIKRLEQLEINARKIAESRVRLVRYAGVLISLMLIILFY